MVMKMQLKINGEHVEGEITSRSAGDINVKITRPYSELTAGAHIMNLARAHMSFEGADGDKRAKELLAELYDISQFLEIKMANLKRSYEKAQIQVSSVTQQYTHEVFINERKELKALMKLGEVTSNDYQKKIKSLKTKAEDFENKRSAIMNAFIKESFPMEISADLHEQVIAKIAAV